MSRERRRFSRIPFDATAHVVSANGSWYTKLLDVSLKGALVSRPRGWVAEIGEHFLLELVLEDSDVVISMKVTISHINEQHVGFCCLHIGLDSITHLRRLVELNLGDEGLLERELAALSDDVPTVARD